MFSKKVEEYDDLKHMLNQRDKEVATI